MGEYDCDHCSPLDKDLRGCVTDDKSVSAYTINGVNIWRCPLALFTEMPVDDRNLINELKTTTYFIDKGILPKAGGWKDQDMFYMACVPIINKYVNLFISKKM